MYSINIRIFLLIFLIAIFSACKHHPETLLIVNPPINGEVNPIDIVTNPCSPDTVYFTNTILPILLSHCSMPGCHNTATNDNGGIVLTNYSQIMNYVQPFSLGGSELWDDAINETDPDKIMPPPDANQLTSAETTSIQSWILQGALNNSCSECDTTFTFAADILPIIQSNCSGCHSGNNPSAGLMLETHDQIQACASSDNLMNRINGEGAIMPPNSYGIGSCHKNQIQEWINEGMPNN